MGETEESRRTAVQALAKGGRTNFAGFLLRLGARLPFLVLAARLYGAEELGRFAYATMVVEFVAAIATLGLKRGLASEMAHGGRPQTHVLADGLLLTLLLALLGAGVLMLVPGLMLPGGEVRGGERWLALVVPAAVMSDVALSGLAFRHRIDVAVRARSLVEPWVLTIAATALAFTAWQRDGLLIAYALSMLAACAASLWPALRLFGPVQGWRPSFGRMWGMASRNLPLAGADLVEWSIRRLDVFLLGRFAGAEMVGIYYVAQQVATLAGKIRVSFDPILAPMLSTALKAGRPAEAAAHIRQVGFWVLAFQIPVVLALGLPGEGVMGLFGPEFAVGAAVMALLLTAELAAATSSVSEMGLIYARPRFNLVIAVGGLLLQAVLSLLLIPAFGGEGAAGALLLGLVAAAIVRQVVLGRVLGADVGMWRWSLLAAGALAFAFGYAARALPELPQMVVAIPGVLLLFGAAIWKFGFRAEDRALFRRRG
ncbi:oligosaccharide flippase family protein [Sandaracinobacter sp. RS1-74]|uniref:lipopolysaccharide biosynthesis protein n=1 Tax=Sandaracinobacteroides sayramensis TaxID=2913411 RepID=UPI001EDC92A5|nr:oligosaccharide flippase family protein [Sandaracinobacteroides sayramensis]MCG2839788.1 oligosaccharide flippase family protein [Sandaracinobacteroides sayramensis]